MTTSESGVSTYRPSARRARVASALLLAVTIAAALRLLAAFAGLVLFRISTHDVVSASTFDTYIAVWTAAGSVYFLAVVACAIGFLAWLSRAVDNVPSLGGGQAAVSPRWAIAWWFIPFGNLGMPYEVVRDLHNRMSQGPVSGHRPLLVAWWLLFVAGDALDAAASFIPSSTVLTATRYLVVEATAGGLLVAAGVLGLLVVRQIEQLAQARASLLSPLPAGDGADNAPSPDTGTRAQTLEPTSGRNWRLRPSWVSFIGLTGTFVLIVVAMIVGSSGPFGSPSERPHEDADLEGSLPHTVMGQTLDVWSVRGRHYFVDVIGLDQASLDEMTANLAKLNLKLEDVSSALAGRSAPEDPPYLVVAIRFRGLNVAQELGTFGIDNPDAGTWSSLAFGNKQVQKGSLAMYEQTTSLRGLPYVYDRQDVRYIVVTDNPVWAADALEQLP